MKAAQATRALDDRLRLLEAEAALQRTALAATLRRWQDRQLLAAGSALASVVWKLVAAPKLRWLVIGTLLARLRGRGRHG